MKIKIKIINRSNPDDNNSVPIKLLNYGYRVRPKRITLTLSKCELLCTLFICSKLYFRTFFAMASAATLIYFGRETGCTRACDVYPSRGIYPSFRHRTMVITTNEIWNSFTIGERFTFFKCFFLPNRLRIHLRIWKQQKKMVWPAQTMRPAETEQ